MSNQANVSVNRRDFLRLSALGGTGVMLSACSTLRPLQPLASDEVRIGLIGVGGKGMSVLGDVLKQKGTRITAVCDADSAHCEAANAELVKKGKAKAEVFIDYRKLLESSEVDAVIISTPNHWHALLAITSVQAGKHVYVEKPVTHTLFESRQLAIAAKKFGRVIQGGTQNRTDVGLMPAFAKLHAGAIGKIKRVTGITYRFRGSIGRATGPVEIPKTVDFDLWCGPAPKVVPKRRKFHYDWHYFWATGGGDISNQGPHELDLVRWALGEPKAPRRVLALGGRFNWNDDGEAPNTAMVVYDYPGVEVVFDVRNLPMKAGADESPAYKSLRTGVYVECENGAFAGGRGGARLLDLDGKVIEKFSGDGGGGHLGNFLEAIRKGDDSGLHAPMRISTASAALSHFGTVAYRAGAKLGPDAAKEMLQGNDAALALYERQMEHLKVNNWDAGKEPLTVGGWLEWDEDKFQFTGGTNHEAANQMVSRDYRAPFIVPKLG